MAPALLWGHADAGRPVSGHGVPLACGHDHDDLVDPVGHAGVPGLHHGHDHQNARRRPEPHALPARRQQPLYRQGRGCLTVRP